MSREKVFSCEMSRVEVSSLQVSPIRILPDFGCEAYRIVNYCLKVCNSKRELMSAYVILI